jgi:hypothetical protein
MGQLATSDFVEEYMQFLKHRIVSNEMHAVDVKLNGGVLPLD